MKKFAKGQKYEIKPSMGFCDIQRGEVEIIRVAKYEDVADEYADPEVIVEQFDPKAKHRDWIVYKYTDKNPKGIRYERFCLDNETFEYHIGNPR